MAMEKFFLMNGYAKVLEFTHGIEFGREDFYTDIQVVNFDLLPLRIKANPNIGGLGDWIVRRSVPVNRHHMEAVLGALNLEKPFDLMRYSHALSLNDTFWLQEETENLNFDKINLYDNPFDEALGWIAFTGLPSDVSRNLSTPELTTSGVLPKYWQRIGVNDIILCKGGTSGYANAGYEPYHEVVAYLVARHLKVDSIPYKLAYRNKKIVSISNLFTTKEYGLMTANEYLDYNFPTFKYKTLRLMFEANKNDNIDDFDFHKMCFLDYIIENSDRHLNNWGYRMDNLNQKIAGFSPLWDNGMSLDYGKPLDLRTNFSFASFNVKYDFIQESLHYNDFKHKTNELLVLIRNGKLSEEIWDNTKDYYRSEELLIKTVKFIEDHCIEFLAFFQQINQEKSALLAFLQGHFHSCG
jgi:hypothetical protein